MMKVVAGAIVGFIIGALSMQLMTPTQAPSAPEHREWAALGVQQIQNSGDAEAQLKAAEEYYGKAVVLFLAGLIREVNGTHPTSATAVLAEPVVKEIPPQESITSTESAALATVTNSQGKVEFQPQPAKVMEADKALNNLVAHRKAPMADKMTPQVRKMMGSFEGRFRWENGKNKGRVDHVAMNMNFYMENGKDLHGDISIVLTDPEGKAYSNMNGNGKNQTLRLVQGRKDQIYIEPAPGDFILMDIRNPNRMSGPYYNQDGQHLGKIEIWRK